MNVAIVHYRSVYLCKKHEHGGNWRLIAKYMAGACKSLRVPVYNTPRLDNSGLIL